jgi:hypothetical protein
MEESLMLKELVDTEPVQDEEREALRLELQALGSLRSKLEKTRVKLNESSVKASEFEMENRLQTQKQEELRIWIHRYSELLSTAVLLEILPKGEHGMSISQVGELVCKKYSTLTKRNLLVHHDYKSLEETVQSQKRRLANLQSELQDFLRECREEVRYDTLVSDLATYQLPQIEDQSIANISLEGERLAEYSAMKRSSVDWWNQQILKSMQCADTVIQR